MNLSVFVVEEKIMKRISCQSPNTDRGRKIKRQIRTYRRTDRGTYGKAVRLTFDWLTSCFSWNLPWKIGRQTVKQMDKETDTQADK